MNDTKKIHIAKILEVYINVPLELAVPEMMISFFFPLHTAEGSVNMLPALQARPGEKSYRKSTHMLL